MHHRTCSWLVGLAFVASGIVGCSNAPEFGSPIASMHGQAIDAPEPAAVDQSPDAPLDWTRLERIISDTAKDQGKTMAQDSVRPAAETYAKKINARHVDEMKQFHLDRAALILERQRTSGVLLAEGANLRGRATSGGRSSRGSRDIGRIGGGTSRSSSRSSSGSSRGTSSTGSSDSLTR